MKKAECEKILRHLIHTWLLALSDDDLSRASFSRFKSAVPEHSRYLNFRSLRGAGEDTELWFDGLLSQVRLHRDSLKAQ